MQESLDVVNLIVKKLEPLSTEDQTRVIMAVCILLGIIGSKPII